MSPEMLDLARRAVVCEGWRWMPGMRALCDDGWPVPYRLDDGHDDWPHDIGLRLPDLTDPATLGCVLALVRDAWGDPTLSPCWQDETGGWDVVGNRWNIIAGSTTEAEALVAALEAA